ncbi:MAG: ErfK/YbiS/YcfS/YnhG family protein [uncultured bacterium]|nr:MAG: ErfK/YbiS/YcfS/YnhG family protein [uncultured bacterium]
MKNFIPHKDNPHAGRRTIGVIFITTFSLTLVYFGGNYVKEFEGKASAVEIQKVENIQTQTSKPELIISSAPEILNLTEEVDENRFNEEATPISDNETLATTIEEAKASVPILRAKDPKKRLDEARIYAKPVITEGKYIDISLEHQNMVLFEGGRFVDAYLVSSGKKGMDTPIGNFKIENKTPRAWSKTYGLFMPNWMAIEPNGKYGIHELPEWPGGYKEGANHLGVAVSHGCVRLGEGSAKRVYDWADIGTPIIIHK